MAVRYPAKRGRPTEVRNITASYTLGLGDVGKTIHLTGSKVAPAITIPANSSVAFPVGTVIRFEQDATSAWNLAITTDTLRWSKDNSTGTRVLGVGASARIIKTTATTWKVDGSALVT